TSGGRARARRNERQHQSRCAKARPHAARLEETHGSSRPARKKQCPRIERMKAYLYSTIIAAFGCGIIADVSIATDGGTGGCGGRPDGAMTGFGATSVKGIAIATVSGYNLLDPLGYAPYASEGCTLVYIASDGSLRLRNLESASEETIAPSTEQPRRPTI